MRMNKSALWLIVLLVILADQLSKWWMNTHFQLGEVLRVTDWFDWVLAHNRGAAFSFLADGILWQRILLSLISVAAIIFMMRLLSRHGQSSPFYAGLSLIMGGAIGNLIDRLMTGEVTDFIQWHVGNHYWPAFNLADSAITLGVTLLLWDQFKKS